MLDTGWRVLHAGCFMKEAACKMLDVRCCMIDGACCFGQCSILKYIGGESIELLLLVCRGLCTRGKSCKLEKLFNPCGG